MVDSEIPLQVELYDIMIDNSEHFCLALALHKCIRKLVKQEHYKLYV